MKGDEAEKMMFDLEPTIEKTLLRADDGAYVSYRIPGIVMTHCQTLLACCEGRSHARSDWGSIDILLARSEDDGATWSPFRVIQGQTDASAVHTYSNPTLIVDNELIHLIYHCDYRQAFVLHSADDGCTWSEPEEITDTFLQFPFGWNVCATGPGHGIRLQEGRLLAPIWLACGEEENGVRKHFPSVAGCIYSDDRGKNWKAGPLASELFDGNETTVAQTCTGSVLFNFRTRHACHKRFIGRLEAGTAAYSDIQIAEALDDPMCFGSMLCLANGEIAFVNCGSAVERRDLTLHISSDSGASWRYAGRLDPSGGYADIACAGKRLYVLFERSDTESKCVQELVLKVFIL